MIQDLSPKTWCDKFKSLFLYSVKVGYRLIYLVSISWIITKLYIFCVRAVIVMTIEVGNAV